MKDFTVAELIQLTANLKANFDHCFVPDKNDKKVPPSIFTFNPLIFEEDSGFWHVILGTFPDEGVWTIGTTLYEAMNAFDKEMKLRLDENGTIVHEIAESERQKLHEEIF